MARRLRGHLNYANVAATLALVLAVGGAGAYAIDKIGPKQIKRHAVRAKHIKSNAVTSRHIAAGQVGGSEIADAGVGASEIADGAVGASELTADSIGPAQLADVGDFSAVGRSASPGETVPLADKGGLTLSGDCRDLGGGLTEAQIRLSTTENGARWLTITDDENPADTGVDSGFGSESSAGFATLNAGPGAILTATAGTTPATGFLDSVYLLAITPGGTVLHGYAGGAANIGVLNACAFAASGFG